MATIRAIYEDGQIRLLDEVDLKEGQELKIEIIPNTKSKKKKNQHVIRRDNGWAVRGEGNVRDTVRTRTKNEAIKRATEIARNQGSEVLIHGREGIITEKYSKHRKFGLHRGLMKMSDDFDAPLPDSFWLGEEE